MMMTFRHASLWDFDVSCELSGNFSVASFQFVKPLDTNELGLTISGPCQFLFCFGSEASVTYVYFPSIETPILKIQQPGCVATDNISRLFAAGN